ncbi:hypothetical protein GQ600_25955 [Phytophthora cactorum]|nr:hypothetical protein GQ600_25955 [Phytophthora cactorum]
MPCGECDPGSISHLYLSERNDQEGPCYQPYQERGQEHGTVPKRVRLPLASNWGACALLAAGKSDLVIQLMGRWPSWDFLVYTRLQPGMIRDAASSTVKASTWEHNEPGLIALEGEVQRA